VCVRCGSHFFPQKLFLGFWLMPSGGPLAGGSFADAYHDCGTCKQPS